MRESKKSSFLINSLIVVYAILFEWAIFGADDFVAPVNALKLLIPGLLLLLIPIGKLDSVFRRYVIFFVLFMLWSLIPSVFAAEYQETVVSWFKYLPRLLFVVVVGIYFLKRPGASVTVMKTLVIIGVLTVLQFLILVPAMLYDVADPFYLSGLRATHFGPLGLLGNQNAVMYFSELPFPVFRLTGFWHEPSNASGFLFAAFFLARAV